MHIMAILCVWGVFCDFVLFLFHKLNQIDSIFIFFLLSFSSLQVAGRQMSRYDFFFMPNMREYLYWLYIGESLKTAQH